MKRFLSLILALALALSMTACGGAAEETPSADLAAIYEGYTKYLPEMFTPDEMMMLDFLGIVAEDCAQYHIAICAEGLRADEVWLIEAKDEKALENLLELAELRIQAKKDETVSYVPEQYVIVEKGQILTKGLYLCLLVSPDVDAMKAEFEAAFQ